MNYGLGKVIGDDETGFRGVADRPYRIEAWDFLAAGGAIFDHLDYSYTIDHENGTAQVVSRIRHHGAERKSGEFARMRGEAADAGD